MNSYMLTLAKYMADETGDEYWQFRYNHLLEMSEIHLIATIPFCNED